MLITVESGHRIYENSLLSSQFFCKSNIIFKVIFINLGINFAEKKAFLPQSNWCRTSVLPPTKARSPVLFKVLSVELLRSGLFTPLFWVFDLLFGSLLACLFHYSECRLRNKETNIYNVLVMYWISLKLILPIFRSLWDKLRKIEIQKTKWTCTEPQRCLLTDCAPEPVHWDCAHQLQDSLHPYVSVIFVMRRCTSIYF